MDSSLSVFDTCLLYCRVNGNVIQPTHVHIKPVPLSELTLKQILPEADLLQGFWISSQDLKQPSSKISPSFQFMTHSRSNVQVHFSDCKSSHILPV